MKPIPGFPGYFADRKGNIYSKKVWGSPYSRPPKRPRLLRKSFSGSIKRNGYRNFYYKVGIFTNGKQTTMNVSSLILITFVGSRPAGMWACHGANGQRDDSIKNLYWGTPKDNAQDRYRDGTDCAGDKNYSAKLSRSQIGRIRKASASGITNSILARRFNVHASHIWRIVNHINWKRL